MNNDDPSANASPGSTGSPNGSNREPISASALPSGIPTAEANSLPPATKRRPVALGAALGLMALIGAGFFLTPGCDKGGGLPFFEEKLGKLDYDVPLHFVSHDLEKEYSTRQAIPNRAVIDQVAGAAVEVQAHPDNKRAQLRLIRLPQSVKATEEAARILAESRAIQDGDIILTFRPLWWKFNAYCNLQLGVSHAAMTIIEEEGGRKYVHTVESPLTYCSRLNAAIHYRGHDAFHIVRPRLTETQKKNVVGWSQRILKLPDQDLIPFFQDYGMPYQFRKKSGAATGILPVDLAKVLLYARKELKVPVYCSELVWAILALRDINPDDVLKNYPPGKDPTDWLKQNVKNMIDPLPGFTTDPLSVPGLMQGPDIQLRALFGADDAQRRQFMLDRVLITKLPNPAETEGNLSPGHAAVGEIFRRMKLPQLREFYGPQQEDSSVIPKLNEKIAPNYSPTGYMIFANLPKAVRQFDYVGTVSYLPAPGSSANPAP